MTDSATVPSVEDRLEALEQQVSNLAGQLAERSSQDAAERTARLAADIDAIVRAVSEHEPDPGLPGGPHPPGTMPQYLAQHLYGKPAISAAIDARRLFRIRPKGYATTMLTTQPPPVKDVPDDIVGWLRQDHPRTRTPRLAASFAELRTRFNKNTIHRTVHVLTERNEVVVGILDTGRPGRPPRVIGLAGEPLPTHVDGLPVRWQS